MTRRLPMLSALLRLVVLVAITLLLIGSVALLGYVSVGDRRHDAPARGVERPAH